MHAMVPDAQEYIRRHVNCLASTPGTPVNRFCKLLYDFRKLCNYPDEHFNCKAYVEEAATIAVCTNSRLAPCRQCIPGVKTSLDCWLDTSSGRRRFLCSFDMFVCLAIADKMIPGPNRERCTGFLLQCALLSWTSQPSTWLQGTAAKPLVVYIIRLLSECILPQEWHHDCLALCDEVANLEPQMTCQQSEQALISIFTQHLQAQLASGGNPHAYHLKWLHIFPRHLGLQPMQRPGTKVPAHRRRNCRSSQLYHNFMGPSPLLTASPVVPLLLYNINCAILQQQLAYACVAQREGDAAPKVCITAQPQVLDSLAVLRTLVGAAVIDSSRLQSQLQLQRMAAFVPLLAAMGPQEVLNKRQTPVPDAYWLMLSTVRLAVKPGMSLPHNSLLHTMRGYATCLNLATCRAVRHNIPAIQQLIQEATDVLFLSGATLQSLKGGAPSWHHVMLPHWWHCLHASETLPNWMRLVQVLMAYGNDEDQYKATLDTEADVACALRLIVEHILFALIRVCDLAANHTLLRAVVGQQAAQEVLQLSLVLRNFCHYVRPGGTRC